MSAPPATSPNRDQRLCKRPCGDRLGGLRSIKRRKKGGGGKCGNLTSSYDITGGSGRRNSGQEQRRPSNMDGRAHWLVLLDKQKASRPVVPKPTNCLRFGSISPVFFVLFCCVFLSMKQEVEEEEEEEEEEIEFQS